MNKKINALIIGVVAVFVGIASILIIKSQQDRSPATVKFADYKTIADMASDIDFSKYNPDSIIEANTDTGNLKEKIKGDPNAPVVIYEYADYACGHCAEMNTELNRIYNEYGGKVAIVFRNYMLNFLNSVTAASAANAAAMQGYWDRYKNILFSEQSSWYKLKGSALENYFIKAFEEASGGAGDVEQFKSDMGSQAVVQRIAFDQAAGDAVGLSGTPLFRINGQQVLSGNLRTKIDELLNS